ncbi:MAG: RES family NAD+ phosphorylase [Planctomycetes bacterium]|nr:RES family NAD+ phosphorylase [Planctomycetota bacterium]
MTLKRGRTVHPKTGELRVALRKCLSHARPWSGTIYRFATVQHANRANLLSGAGSRRHGGRWNPPGMFNCVYGSLDPHAAMEESFASFTAFGIPPEKARPRVFVAVTLKLYPVLDITATTVLKSLRLTEEELRAVDWQDAQTRGEEALTQAIGRLAWEEKLEALIVPSARQIGSLNLVLFPGRRRRGSSWKIQGARDLPRSQ